MKKKFLHGLIVLMLLGSASESCSSNYFNWMKYVPSQPSSQTMQRYAPWGLGGAGLGAGLGYGAGRYFGYDPRLVTAIGLLLGGGLGAYGKAAYQSFLKSKSEELEKEKKKREEEEKKEYKQKRHDYFENFKLGHIFNSAFFGNDSGREYFKWFGEQNNKNKSKLAEFLLKNNIIKIGKNEEGHQYYDFDSEKFEKNYNRQFNDNPKLVFIRAILNFIDAFMGNSGNLPFEKQKLLIVTRLSQYNTNDQNYDEAKKILQEYFGTPEDPSSDHEDKGKEKE